MGLTQITIVVDIDEENGLFNGSCLGIENQTRSLFQAVEETLNDLDTMHTQLQGVEDELLSPDGIALRDTLFST